MEKSSTTKNLKDNNKIAKDVINILHEKKINIVLLYGELGSGKTTFTKFLARELEIKKPITSPTFLISKEYEIKKVTRYTLHVTRLIHYDLYRLRSQNDLEEIGFWEKIADRKNLIIIEWPNKISWLVKKLKQNHKNKILKINFFHTQKENSRKIKIDDLH